MAVSPLVLPLYLQEGPSAEELEEARAKESGCLTRQGGGEAYARWRCYEPLLFETAPAPPVPAPCVSEHAIERTLPSSSAAMHDSTTLK